jgi:hypothetical protein
MPILNIIIIIALAGFILWAINAYIPMQPMVKNLLNVAVVIILVLWLLQLFGVLAHLGTVRVG